MNESQSDGMATLPSTVSIRLLDLLSSDDAFRDKFTNTPREALAHAGYVWGQDGNEDNDKKLEECCKVKSLAPKEVIKSARSELQHMLTSGISQITPQLDSGLENGGRTLK